MKGAAIVVKSLQDCGVNVAFGYIGSSIMPVFDALIGSGIEVVTTASESGAAYAADGYARSVGKTGVVLATSGPGATNLVTGLASAYMDSVPVFALTANVARSKLGKDSFQEVDITGVVTPITKYTRIIESVNELEYEIKRAYALTTASRNAPVLIDVPYDILFNECDYANIDISVFNVEEPKEEEIRVAADIINLSRNPIILVGGGGVKSDKEIAQLADTLRCPIVTTMRAVGAVRSPRYIGMIGSSARRITNRIYSSADTVIAVGTRFSDKLYSTLSKKKYVHIDVDKAELNKIVTEACSICGDAKNTLTKLIPLISERNSDFNMEVEAKPRNSTEKLASEIVGSIQDGTILATDVGAHQTAIMNAVGFRYPNELLSSTGLGAMGYGLGAAIGAAYGTKKKVVLVTGDGSFNMGSNELATAVKLKLPIIIIVVNNHSLKMIKDLQRAYFGGRITAVETPDVNFVALAKAYGAKGKRVSKKNIKKEITLATLGETPTVLDVKMR